MNHCANAVGWGGTNRPRWNKQNRARGAVFDVRAALFALLGNDLTQSNGLGPYLALKFIAECGDDLSAWPSAKHYLLLCLAPSNKISGGKVLSSRTRRYGQPGSGASEARRGNRTNRHRLGCLLPTAFRANRQGQGDHRDRA